jgi:Tfp pilus assembly PilM family ATPase
MPRHLAIEWDQQHVRFAVVTSGRAQPKVVHAVTVPLPPAGEDRDTHTSEVIGKKLGAALAAHGVSANRANVCVGRAAIEIQRLMLPPCPDEDLPDLVRNQAVRELSSVGEDSVVDFVTIGADASKSRPVMATAMSAAEQQFIREVCEQANLTPRRLMLRPYAAASRFLAAKQEPQGACMLVDVSGNEAELVVLDDEHVVFTRAVLLPADSLQNALLDPLLPEISRTIMAVQNQTDIETVDRIFVSGDTEHHQSLTDQITAELDVAAEVFDPFADLDVAPSTDVERAGQPRRFIALLGVLLDEANNVAPSIDFAHPRKRPAPPNRRRQIASAVGAVAAILAVFFYFGYQDVATLRDKYERLAEEAKQSKTTAATAKAMVESVEEIEAWSNSDVIWLDEFRELSQRFPNRRDAVLFRLTMQRAPGGGVMVLQGLVRAPGIVGRMEEALRDDFHKVNSDNLQEKALDGAYAWQFDTEITVAKRDKSQYVSPAPPTPDDDTIRPTIPSTGPPPEGSSPPRRGSEANGLPVPMKTTPPAAGE